jgi:hypothetical protein
VKRAVTRETVEEQCTNSRTTCQLLARWSESDEPRKFERKKQESSPFHRIVYWGPNGITERISEGASLSTRLNPPPEEVTIRLDPAQEAVETPELQVTQRSHTRSAQSLYRLLGIGFAFTDALCISAALLLSHQIRWGTWFSNDYLIAQS